MFSNFNKIVYIMHFRNCHILKWC